jgi:D-sedoheptulose 7-phosphate isomerase
MPKQESESKKICSFHADYDIFRSAGGRQNPASGSSARELSSETCGVVRGPMHYAQQYRTELLNALTSIDLRTVDDAVDSLREARAHGRCIFVCGHGSSGAACSHLLCEMFKTANISRTVKFRALALTDELRHPNDVFDEAVFVDQLRIMATPGDVVLGISATENARALLRALTYAREAGCHTVCISGRSEGKLASMAEKSILTPASELGSVEDAQMIVCRMIGHYFLNIDEG